MTISKNIRLGSRNLPLERATTTGRSLECQNHAPAQLWWYPWWFTNDSGFCERMQLKLLRLVAYDTLIGDQNCWITERNKKLWMEKMRACSCTECKNSPELPLDHFFTATYNTQHATTNRITNRMEAGMAHDARSQIWQHFLKCSRFWWALANDCLVVKSDGFDCVQH